MNIPRIKKLLDEIRNSLKLIEKLVDLPYEDFISDIRNRYTLRLALIEIVEASVAIGLIILKELGDVEKIEGYIQVFRKLIEHRVLTPETGNGMEKLVRLRNMIVHRYWDVDDSKIYRDARENGLGVIRNFVFEVEKYVTRIRGE